MLFSFLSCWQSEGRRRCAALLAFLARACGAARSSHAALTNHDRRMSGSLEAKKTLSSSEEGGCHRLPRRRRWTTPVPLGRTASGDFVRSMCLPAGSIQFK